MEIRTLAVADDSARPPCRPGRHGGFLGGEFGMKGDPDGFAVTLRQILAVDR